MDVDFIEKCIDAKVVVDEDVLVAVTTKGSFGGTETGVGSTDRFQVRIFRTKDSQSFV